MSNKNQAVLVLIASLGVSSCTSTYLPFYSDAQMEQVYPHNYQEQTTYYAERPAAHASRTPLEAAQTEHAEPKPSSRITEATQPYPADSYQAPTPHKSRDRSWVKSQSPQGYTIEVADGEQAAGVAGKLHQAPQSERMATVQYERNGKTRYKGLYGTYGSYEEARRVLSTLPSTVQSGASIRSWGSVQSNLP